MAAYVAFPLLILILGPPGRHSFFSGFEGVITNMQSLPALLLICLVFGFTLSGWLPRMQAGSARLSLVSFLLIAQMTIAFAAQDLWESHSQPRGDVCFSVGRAATTPKGEVVVSTDVKLSRVDALYFAVGNFATTGAGSVVPVSAKCRRMVAEQTALGALTILVGVSGFAATLLSRARGSGAA